MLRQDDQFADRRRTRSGGPAVENTCPPLAINSGIKTVPKLPPRPPNDEGNLAEHERAIPPCSTRPGTYVALSPREFAARHYRPIEHVIEPWLPVGGLATVVGDRGVGKTSFVL